MARLGDTWRTAPGPGDLTRTNDPQNQTPGACPECEGNHPVSRCPAVARMFTAPPRRTETKEAPVAIKRDLSDLPPAPGLAPDPTPRFVGVLADQWAEENYLAGDKPTANGTPFRHSDAGKCARAISYTAAGIPKSDPMDITGVWNTRLGTLIHDEWQAALQARWPGAEVEVTCSMVGADGSGHVDAVIREHDWDAQEELDALGVETGPGTGIIAGQRTIAYELKTVGGRKFKGAVGALRKGTPAEGPDTGHLLQAAVNGRAVDADEVIVGYLAKECISKNEAKRFGITDDVGRFAAEWTFTREQFEPLADLEAERVAGILALVADGKLAARKLPDMPPRSEITDPSTGDWEQRIDGEVTDTGNTFWCSYCPFQTVCSTTEAGRIPVESVVAIGAVA